MGGVGVEAAVENEEDIADVDELAAVEGPAAAHADQAAGAGVDVVQLSKRLKCYNYAVRDAASS